MLTPDEREAIERLSRVARGEADHEFFDDRPSLEEEYATDPSGWDWPAATPAHWAPEVARLAKLAEEPR
jgi:hypothetical protein